MSRPEPDAVPPTPEEAAATGTLASRLALRQRSGGLAVPVLTALIAFLLDAARAGQYGGTGQTTDWDLARCAATSHRIILSGGLKVENVAEAIRIVRPYGVDVASGIETKPGKKDHVRLKEFIDEIRRAERQLEQQLERSKENPIQP